jgi:hypothetical protein
MRQEVVDRLHHRQPGIRPGAHVPEIREDMPDRPGITKPQHKENRTLKDVRQQQRDRYKYQ